MENRDTRSAYELLRRAMQRQYLLQQTSNLSASSKDIPDYHPNDDSGLQGGILGELLAEQNYRKKYDESKEQSLPARESSFRILSRMPAVSLSKDGLKSDGPSPPSSAPTIQQYRMAGPTHSQCVDRCLHLLPSPSGDLQSSEFRKCVGKCMGRLL